LAKETFHGNAETYGFLTAAMGIGAVMGGLFTATRGKTGLRPFTIGAAMFGVAMLFAALSPVLGTEYLALALVGWGSVSFLATGNSTLQVTAAPSMRGRVMALWAVAFLGSTPIGGPAIGWVVAAAGARVGLGVGSLSCLVATGVGVLAITRLKANKQTEAAAPVDIGTGAPVSVARK
jgi:MFS family permease